MKNKVIGTLLAAMICACPLSMQTRAGEDVDSLQAQIAELQAENADLKEQLDSAEFAMAYFFDLFDATLNGDINVDGVTDAIDAIAFGGGLLTRNCSKILLYESLVL